MRHRWLDVAIAFMAVVDVGLTGIYVRQRIASVPQTIASLPTRHDVNNDHLTSSPTSGKPQVDCDDARRGFRLNASLSEDYAVDSNSASTTQSADARAAFFLLLRTEIPGAQPTWTCPVSNAGKWDFGSDASTTQLWLKWESASATNPATTNPPP